MPNFSITSFLNDRIKLYQPEKGYRFSIDAPLLADFITPSKNDIMFEIGSGCGIIPIILNVRDKGGKKIISVEIQKSLYNIALKNIEVNGLNKKIEIIYGDVKNIYQGFSDSFDIVFTNPPYNQIESGRVSDKVEKIIACNEIYLKLEDIFKISSWLLKKGGALYIIFPSEREKELLKSGEKYNFFIGKIRNVFSKKEDKKANFVLAKFLKDKKENFFKEKDLFIYEKDKEYSKDFLKIIS